ncbi:MAG: GNAT family N-acetyltransferase [Candidatus Rokuibacteriota bacterium]|nr:MAG: GNAT family N-acetyltransferase [Candidatus Rokubacteria bacterium]
MTPSLVAGRMRIRPPRAADAEQLGVLNRQLGYAAEIQELVARIDRLSGLREHFVAVAEVDGTVVGWVQAEHRFSMEAGDKAELVGLIVGAAARRSGVGGLLVQAAEDWAADRGLRSIVVRSNVIRPESHSFYKQIGYTQSKTQHVYAKSLQRKSAEC